MISVSASAQHFPNGAGEPPTYPFGNWVISSQPSQIVEPGDAYRGISVGTDHSVSVGNTQILRPVGLLNSSSLAVYPSPSGTAVLVVQVQGLRGYRMVIVDFERLKFMGADVVPGDRVSGIATQPSWELGSQVAWSPDSTMVMINRSRVDRQTEAALVNLSDGRARSLAPQGLEGGQWEVAQIHTARPIKSPDTHAVNFMIWGCYDDDCFDYGPIREAMVMFTETTMETEIFPLPYELDPSGEWRTGWLQFSSKKLREDAIAEAQRVEESIQGNVDIFQASNGWHALVAGMWTDPEFNYIETYKRDNGLPSDALIASGKNYATWVPQNDTARPPFQRLRVGDNVQTYLDREMTEYVSFRTFGQYVDVYSRAGEACQLGYREPEWISCRALEGGMEAPVREHQGPVQATPAAVVPEVTFPFETALSTPPTGDQELDFMVDWLETYFPSLLETLNLTPQDSSDMLEREVSVRVAYLVGMMAKYATSSPISEFEDPSYIADIYKSYVRSGGLDGVKSASATIGAETGKSLAISLVKDIAASFLTDVTLNLMPELTPAVDSLARAGVKAGWLALADSVEVYQSPDKLVWLVLERAYDWVEIAKASKGLADQRTENLTMTALGIQSAAIVLYAYGDDPQAALTAARTLAGLDTYLADAVGRDDVEEVKDIYFLGFAALRHLYEGNTAMAEALRADLVSRADGGDWPSLSARDLFVYLADWGRDAPERAAFLMVNVTDLADMDRTALEATIPALATD